MTTNELEERINFTYPSLAYIRALAKEVDLLREHCHTLEERLAKLELKRRLVNVFAEYDASEAMKEDLLWPQVFKMTLGQPGFIPNTATIHSVRIPGTTNELQLWPNNRLCDISEVGTLQMQREDGDPLHAQLRIAETKRQHMSKAGSHLVRPNQTYGVLIDYHWIKWPETWCNFLQFWGFPLPSGRGNDICTTFIENGRARLACWPRGAKTYAKTDWVRIDESGQFLFTCNSEFGCSLKVRGLNSVDWVDIGRFDTPIGSGRLLSEPDGWAAFSFGPYSVSACQVDVNKIQMMSVNDG